MSPTPDGSVGDATVSIEQDATSKDEVHLWHPGWREGPKGDKGADGTGAGTVTEVKVALASRRWQQFNAQGFS